MNDNQRKCGEAFRAGCRHCLARRKMPSMDQLRTDWGFSTIEAEAFQGGYEITELTKRSIRSRSDKDDAEAARKTLDRLERAIERRRARQRLADILAARLDALDSDRKFRTAFEAGQRKFAGSGRMPTGDQFLRLGFTRNDLKAFVMGFEAERVSAITRANIAALDG